MPTIKRTRSIRLDDLKTVYLEELRRRCTEQLSEAIYSNTILPHELEKEIWDYYRRSSASLQEFYSKYTPEWEAFYANESLSPTEFLDFLYRMRSAFSRRYSLAELDLSYYIESMEGCQNQEEKQKQFQEFFLDRWHGLLTQKEYSYQFHHIESLCQGFEILDKEHGMKTAAQMAGSRLRWLLLNRPELYRKLSSYEKEMEQHRAIKELVKLLGRHGKGSKQSFDALSGMNIDQLVHSSSASDIAGITQGDDLNHLLPVEYCYLMDESLYSVFMQRFVEKRLQVFDSRSIEEPSVLQRKKHTAAGQGPFIVCVDTSGSMQGRREHLAKSALLAVAKLTETTRRKCYVINFAEEVQCLLIQDLKADLPMLVEFLNHRFDGGTDIRPAMDEAFRLMEYHMWRDSDVLMISDFEMPPLSEQLQGRISLQKRRGTHFYSLVFGTLPERSYLNICQKYWEIAYL